MLSTPIDIFICSYLRPEYTGKTLQYLKERTRYSYRLFLIDNGDNEQFKDQVDYYIGMSKNLGVMVAWNIASQLAESEYFITSDNDIYVPDLELDWLFQLITFMNVRPDYGAISLHPHVFIGIAGEDPNDPEDVKEAPMCGAVMRIMRTELIRKIGGWEKVIRPQRNGEEKWISSRLREAGYKVGRTTRIRAYHPFGRDIEGNLGWGYTTVTPEEQGHNSALKNEVLRFDNPDAYDEKTWLPKT